MNHSWDHQGALFWPVEKVVLLSPAFLAWKSHQSEHLFVQTFHLFNKLARKTTQQTILDVI